jgi:hypothetical protein
MIFSKTWISGGYKSKQLSVKSKQGGKSNKDIAGQTQTLLVK